ncbi:hypothetical protein ACA910_000453 [Epithemia clementina (nom. ined.)]
MSASSAVFARIRQTSCRLVLGNQKNAVFGGLRSVPARNSPNPLPYLVEPFRTFSTPAITTTEEAAAKEEKIVPGIGKGKTSTGYPGVPVEHDWYNVMLKKFQLLLDTMEQSDMPETAQYRIDVTKWANFVIATVKANPNDPEKVEYEVRMGQVEELIEMADDEMIAMKEYLKLRMWELVAKNAEGPEIDFNPDPASDEAGPNADPRTKKVVEDDLRAMTMAGVDDGDDDEEVDEYADY